MRFLIATIVLLFVSPAFAEVPLSFSIPDARAARMQIVCEAERVNLRYRSDAWDRHICARLIYNECLGGIDDRLVKTQANSTRRTTIQSARAQRILDFPNPAPSICGDSVIDGEFGETCDDGNNEDGDGCDQSCTIE